jgi:HK97 family phage major capsid protein
MFNPDTEILLQQLKDNQGRYILQQPTDNAPGKIWGRPYELSDALPTPDEVQDGDPWIIFGDLKKSCILGDKQQIRVKILEEATITDTDSLTPINLAEQDMIAMRVVERVGYVCVLPEGISVLKNEIESGS